MLESKCYPPTNAILTNCVPWNRDDDVRGDKMSSERRTTTLAHRKRTTRRPESTITTITTINGAEHVLQVV
jgi:hypothetical protein